MNNPNLTEAIRNIDFPDVVISGRASSSYTKENFDARLRELQARPLPHDEETTRELTFLTSLGKRRGWSASE